MKATSGAWMKTGAALVAAVALLAEMGSASAQAPTQMVSRANTARAKCPRLSRPAASANDPARAAPNPQEWTLRGAPRPNFAQTPTGTPDTTTRPANPTPQFDEAMNPCSRAQYVK